MGAYSKRLMMSPDVFCSKALEEIEDQNLNGCAEDNCIESDTYLMLSYDDLLETTVGMKLERFISDETGSPFYSVVVIVSTNMDVEEAQNYFLLEETGESLHDLVFKLCERDWLAQEGT